MKKLLLFMPLLLTMLASCDKNSKTPNYNDVEELIYDVDFPALSDESDAININNEHFTSIKIMFSDKEYILEDLYNLEDIQSLITINEEWLDIEISADNILVKAKMNLLPEDLYLYEHPLEFVGGSAGSFSQTEERNCTISLKNKFKHINVNICQAGLNPTDYWDFRISPYDLNFSAAGGTEYIYVTNYSNPAVNIIIGYYPKYPVPVEERIEETISIPGVFENDWLSIKADESIVEVKVAENTGYNRSFSLEFRAFEEPMGPSVWCKQEGMLE